MLRNLIRSEIWSCACIFSTTLLLLSTATHAGSNSKCCYCQQKTHKRPCISLMQARVFWIPTACVAIEGRSNVVLNMHAQLQVSLPMRFLSLLHEASQRAFGDGIHWLLIWQFFNHFAQFKTTTKSHENYVFLYPFSSMAISPRIMIFFYFILVNCMGW